MHEREKWKGSRSVASDPQQPHGGLPASSVHGIFQARVLEWGAIAFLGKYYHRAAAKSHQSGLTLWDPIDGSPPGSHPWDSPGKNTGVGCHFLLQCMRVKSESEVTQSCLTLPNPMDCSSPGSSVHGILQARRVLEWGAIAFSDIALANTSIISKYYHFFFMWKYLRSSLLATFWLKSGQNNWVHFCMR